jgi:hypothetical protein
MSRTNVRFPSNVLTDGADESNIFDPPVSCERNGALTGNAGRHARKDGSARNFFA